MPHNDTEKNLSEFQSPAESSNHYDKLNLILTERKASELVLDDVWMRKICFASIKKHRSRSSKRD